jgi:predicted nucleic acid-binding protein
MAQLHWTQKAGLRGISRNMRDASRAMTGNRRLIRPRSRRLNRDALPVGYAGGNDLMIPAIALTHGLTLVTHNCVEFERVPGLQVEDWSV